VNSADASVPVGLAFVASAEHASAVHASVVLLAETMRVHHSNPSSDVHIDLFVVVVVVVVVGKK